jgi:hypothetical protein
MDRDYTPYQRKIIQRYYGNQGGLQLQRLAELVTELYLAEGKKTERLWKSAATAMEKLQVPPWRIAHLLEKKDPALIAELVKELQAKGS